jgi:hypothetical protein
MINFILKVKAHHSKYEELKQALVGIDISSKSKAGLKFIIEEQNGCKECNICEIENDVFIINSEWKNKEMLENFFCNRYFKILAGALNTLGENCEITIKEGEKLMNKDYLKRHCSIFLRSSYVNSI